MDVRKESISEYSSSIEVVNAIPNDDHDAFDIVLNEYNYNDYYYLDSQFSSQEYAEYIRLTDWLTIL